MADLRARLAAKSDPHDGGQVEADGSFGCCTDEWFLRLDETVEHLIADGFWLSDPRYPLKLLERINSPEKLRAYLDSILISDIRRTGLHSLRAEHGDLGAREVDPLAGDVEGASDQDAAPSRPPRAILDFMDHKWQDPESGYWGTWYRAADGSIVRTSDLSHTFHLASFRDGRVERWPAIARGRLVAFEGPGLSLRLARAWGDVQSPQLRRRAAVPPGMAPRRRRQRGRSARDRPDAPLLPEETLQQDGSFRMRGDEATLSSNFYFGVAFLNEVGYFSKTRFWSDGEFAEAAEVRARIESRIVKLGLDDPEAKFALAILRMNRHR